MASQMGYQKTVSCWIAEPFLCGVGHFTSWVSGLITYASSFVSIQIQMITYYGTH